MLDNALQQSKKIGKWTKRARVGIYLGRSSQHARTVTLVLSLETGLTSPQFHIKVDSTFQMMRQSFGQQQPTSLWQQKCGFVQLDGEEVPHDTSRAAMVADDRPATTDRMLEVKARALRFGYSIQQQREATMPPSNNQAVVTPLVVTRLSTEGEVAPSEGARSAPETSAHGPIHQVAVEGEPRRLQRIANLSARAADLTPIATQEQDSL